MRCSIACALLVALALGCEGSRAGDPRGSIELCRDQTLDLVDDGEPIELQLPAAHGASTCGRGDPSAEIILRIPPPSGELIVSARSAAGDPLLIAVGSTCGDPTSTSACRAVPDDDGATRLVLPVTSSAAALYVTIRSLTGRASRISVTLHRRDVLAIGAACIPETERCLSDPACASRARCIAGARCIDGRCANAIVSGGERCGDGLECAAAYACVDGVCASAVGHPCDLGPTYCSRSYGVACLDGICRSQIALVGERCVPDDVPSCDFELRCEGRRGEERCVDVLGLFCDDATPLPISNSSAPVEPLAFTIDPTAPSAHASRCGLGLDTPERAFVIEPGTGAVRIEAQRADGLPALMYLRDADCTSDLGCFPSGSYTFFPRGRTYVFVEGVGDHTISARSGVAIASGASCDPADPWTLCDGTSLCDDGTCGGLAWIEDGPSCFCDVSVSGDPRSGVVRAHVTLEPGRPAWFLLTGWWGDPSQIVLTPRTSCPADLVATIWRHTVDCGTRACELPDTSLVDSLVVGDGATCSERVSTSFAAPEVAIAVRLESAIGGEIDLEIDTL